MHQETESLFQDFLGAIVVLSASISSLLVAVNGQISPGLVGLSVTYSLSVSLILWTVDGYYSAI